MSRTITISDIVKEYPHMLKVVIYHEDYHLELPAGKQKKPKSKDYNKEENINRSVRRSKMLIEDVIISNKWSLWVTFTFNKKYVDRYDFNKCRKIMNNWLHRQKDLQYIIVPEFHKDGAVHFHGLLHNYNGTLTDSGLKTKNGQVIYNSSFSSGFDRFIKIDDNYLALANYISKYVTKDMPVIFGRKRFQTSQDLIRPINHKNVAFRSQLIHHIRQSEPEYINDKLELHYIAKTAINMLEPENNLRIV